VCFAQRYDFGIAQGPDEESHCTAATVQARINAFRATYSRRERSCACALLPGGSTFCAIGAAALMDAIPRALIDIDRTRQVRASAAHARASVAWPRC